MSASALRARLATQDVGVSVVVVLDADLDGDGDVNLAGKR